MKFSNKFSLRNNFIIKFQAHKKNELSFSFFENFQSKKENIIVENINIMKIDDVKKENKKDVQS